MVAKIRISQGLYKTIANPIELDKDSALQLINILKNSFELTSESENNRPYGDADFKNTPYEDEITFNEQDKLIGQALHNTLKKYKFSICTSSCFKSKKISWRFTIKEHIGTKSAIKQFIMVEINPLFKQNQELLNVLHPITLDSSVYDKNRKMRMLYSSKDGEDRPLRLVAGEPEDTFITYIPTDTEHQILHEPPVKEQVINIQNTTVSHSFEECEALVDALNVNRSWIDTYEGARTAIWAFWGVEQSDRMIVLLKKIARSGINYQKDVTFIYKLIKEYNPINSKKLTLRTIYWKIKELNPTTFTELKKKFNDTTEQESFVHEIVGYTKPDEWHTYNDWNVPSGHLKDLPIENHNTLLGQSKLGTGKTTQLKKIVATNPDKRIILISARRTFTASMYADFGVKNDFVNYRDIKGSLASYPRIFVQVESLHRLFSVDNIITPFDIVLMDEIESILAQCSPSPTHQGNYIRNMNALQQITEQATKLIAMDAFITQRSIEFLEDLRTDIAFVHNPYQPYNRIAVRTPCNNNKKNTSHFWKAVLETVKAGKRVAIPCGSQKQGLAFEKILIANNISYLFYHSNDDRTMRKETLQDVNASWAKVQVLLYTPSVTIGINYDSKDCQFDQLFMYASAGGGIPRDMFQGSLRARVIKDNKMTFCLDSRSLKPSLVGMENIENAYNLKSNVILNQLKLLEIDADNVFNLPDWNKNLIFRNLNEKNVSIVECKPVYKWYLDSCGYTLQEETYKDTLEYSPNAIPLYDEVVQINKIQAMTIEEAIKNEMNVSDEHRYSLTAYYLLKEVPYFNELEPVAKHHIWLDWNDKIIGRTHIKNVMSEMIDAKTLITKEINKASGCLELMTNQPARIRIIKRLYQILGNRTEFSPDDVWDLAPTLKPIFEGVALKLFGIRDRATKKSGGVYYIHKIAEILKKWDGTIVESVKKDRKCDGVTFRLYGMTIRYSAERRFLPLDNEDDEE